MKLKEYDGIPFKRRNSFKKMECEYCGKNFTSQGNLNKHISTAKYCMKIRGEKIPEFTCELCNNQYSSKSSLRAHRGRCNELYQKFKAKIGEEYEKKLVELTERYENRILELENKLENIAIKSSSKPTTTNNIAIYQNLSPLTENKIQDTVENFSLNDAMNGGVGIAKLALKNGLKDSVLCTDLSRMSAKYKNEEGKVIPDPGLREVSTKIFSSIEGKNSEIMDEYAEGKEEDDPFVRIFKMNKAAEIRNGVHQASLDKGGDVYRDFAKYVCQKTVVN